MSSYGLTVGIIKIMLYFATTNPSKFAIAQHACTKAGIEISQKPLDIAEIQGEDANIIVLDKVRKAYEQTNAPVIVSDDSWEIPVLRGFPGAYMKSIDHWFTSEDFIRLMEPYTDRRITLVAMLAYKDAETEQIFKAEFTGSILPEPRGNFGKPLQKVITMPGDNGLSVSEVYDRGITYDDREVSAMWDQFITWYKEQSA